MLIGFEANAEILDRKAMWDEAMALPLDPYTWKLIEIHQWNHGIGDIR